MELIPRHIQELESCRVFGTKKSTTKGLLYWKNNLVAARGSLVVVAGHKKSRKSLLANCILMSKFIQSENTMNFNWRNCNDDEIIVHFDTEMGDLVEERKRNFDHLCGLDPHFKQYLVFNIKKYDYQEKLEMIDFKVSDLIAKGKTICCLVLDQVGDLVKNRDANDVETVSHLIDYMERWERETNCMILAVIHTNRAGEETNGKLGVMLDNKMESRFLVKKDKKTLESSVENMTRRIEVPHFRFTQDEWDDPVYLGDEEELFF